MITLKVYVDDFLVATVPLWMVKHAIEDAIALYPAQTIRLEAMLDF